MLSQRIVQALGFAAVSLFLVGALTGCPLLFGGGQAGTVMFIATPSSGPAPLAVHFHGTAALAPPYEVERWSWDFGDGATGEERSTKHTYTVPGTYMVTLQVAAAAPKFRGDQDPPPATLKYSQEVNVLNPNLPPIANAGTDQSVFLRTGPVTLDGSESYDPDDDPITYAWSFVSVPGGGKSALTGADTVNPTFTPDFKGDYVIQLIVNDGQLDSAPDTVVVTVGNRPPVANAGPDQPLLFLGTDVTLDGSQSTDPDFDSLTYAWTFVTRPDGSGAELTGADPVHPTFTPDRKGNYVIQLIVNDGTVDSDEPDTVLVTIVNRPPVANAGPDQPALQQDDLFLDQEVTLDGSGSYDLDGDPLTYAWSFETRPPGSTAELTGADPVHPTFTPDRKGDYVIQLIVNDGTVDSDEPDTVVVTIGNRPPVADAGPDQPIPDQGDLFLDEEVTLDGSGSYDLDGDPLTYAWTFVTRPPGSTAELMGADPVHPTFIADRKGVYEIELTVEDDSAATDTDTVLVTIANRPPTAVAVVLPGNEPTADVNRITDSDVLTPNLETLYALPRQIEGRLPLMRIDPDTAAIFGQIPIALIMSEDNHLLPIWVWAGKGLAVDPTTGEMWAIVGATAANGYEHFWALVRLNPYTGVAVPVGDPLTTSLSELYAGLAVDDLSLVYGVTGNDASAVPQKVVNTLHALYKIDTTDTSETFLIQFPEPVDVPLTPGEVIAFNTDDGFMYHATGNSALASNRMFKALNLDTLDLTEVTLTPGLTSWDRPTALTYAPGTGGQFYLADAGGDGPALFRITLTDGTATEDYIGDIDYYSDIKGLAFLYEREFPAPEVMLDGLQSFDPDGDDLTYAWTFFSVPPLSNVTDSALSDPSGETTSFTPDVMGTYVLELVVNDGEADSLPATVTVNYLNMAPVANAGADQIVQQGDYGTPVQLNGGDSYDPDGTELTFEWTLLSAPTGSIFTLSPSDSSAAAPFFDVDVAHPSEPYVFQLTVTDADGATNTTNPVEVLIQPIS
ncbi:MAG TPA: PKD domain-containing protein [Candidatus Bathyarchaeia archaeon]|nr:PKD domain-containing protein [Candidatus Bathyarchaeia archaeon]